MNKPPHWQHREPQILSADLGRRSPETENRFVFMGIKSQNEEREIPADNSRSNLPIGHEYTGF
jgi:hypothetical protein